LAEPPVFEEHVIRPSQSVSPDISQEFEEVSLNGNSSVTSGTPERVLEATIFVGRLNGQKVNRDLVLEQFKQFGTIRYICLFNKGALSPEGGMSHL
jgi:RNA recognition motif-containing protein